MKKATGSVTRADLARITAWQQARQATPARDTYTLVPFTVWTIVGIVCAGLLIII